MTRLFSLLASALIFFSTLFISLPVIGQIEEHDLTVVKKRALKNFASGDYDKAYVDFAELKKQFPREPLYHYYCGICKDEMNTDLEEAAELLYYASSRGVPEYVNFYLGEVYKKLYDFDKAKEYYIKFDKEAPNFMTKEKDSKGAISSAVNASLLTSSYNPYKVLNVTFMDMKNPK